MRSDIQATKIRFGKTRQSGPEHYRRVQVRWDSDESFLDALVMKRDDRDGPGKSDRPYRVAWAATSELARKTEAALGQLKERFSSKHTKGALKKFLKGVPSHFVPPDAEVPLDLAVSIANSRFRLEKRDGPPEEWEREADDAALGRAGLADQADDEVGVRMPALFQWVPWFGELAKKVREVRRDGLVERAKEVDWAGLNCAVLAHGAENADPLTLFYHLAAVAGGKAENREKVYSSVAEAFEIQSKLDYSFNDSFIFPIPPALGVSFYRPGVSPSLLWKMFHQAYAVEGTSYGSVSADTFAKVLQVKGVGVPKLTQVLFLINPKAFLPFDTRAVLPLGVGRIKKPAAKMSWAQYVDEMGRIRTAFPGCQPYEINVIGFLWTSGRLSREDNRWYQIGTSDDEWRGFRDNHWIHRGGLGDVHRPGAGEVLPDPKPGYRIDKPKRGDVVLVRSGTQEGRGIGIVYRNAYREAEAAAKAAAVGEKSLEDLRREGSGFALVIHQNRGMPVRVKRYASYQTVLRAAKSEVLRPAVDRLDVRFHADGRVVAYLTRERDVVVTEVQDGDDPAEIAAGLGGPKLTEAIPRLRKSHPNGRIHMLWVNKEQAHLAANTPTVRFSRVDRAVYKAFAESVAYSATVDLLPRPDFSTPTAVHQLNQILYGPPGTGKTYHATTCAMAIVKGIEADEVTEEHRTEFRSLRFDPVNKTGQIDMVTFHQNFSYEDFVEGIRPRLAEGGDIGYELRLGLFRRIAAAARDDPHRPYVLIIDEINRGNVPKILGELITLMEPTRRLGQQDETTVALPYSGDTFGVPGNLHIIGTMNTADRSILPLDTALRRRFDHVEMLPDPDHPLIADSVAGINLRKMLKAINARISLLMDRERQIGHTYLFNVTDIDSLAAKFRTAILPLLAEYFYDDWSRIRHVLGGVPFVVARPHGEHMLEDEGLLDPDTAIHEVLPATAGEWLDPVQYRRIYEKSVSGGGGQRQDESSDIGDGQS